MKFRKKPVVIDAFHWTGGPDQKEDPWWIVAAIRCGLVGFLNVGTPDLLMTIKTLESGSGVHYATPGDWIIKGVKGELYPCKPDIFEMTYEAAE